MLCCIQSFRYTLFHEFRIGPDFVISSAYLAGRVVYAVIAYQFSEKRSLAITCR